MQAGKAARMAEIQAAKKPKNKTRGRNKIGKREKKKDINIIDEKRKQRMDQLDRSFFSLTLTPTPTPTPTLTLTLTLSTGNCGSSSGHAAGDSNPMQC